MLIRGCLNAAVVTVDDSWTNGNASDVCISRETGPTSKHRQRKGLMAKEEEVCLLFIGNCVSGKTAILIMRFVVSY